ELAEIRKSCRTETLYRRYLGPNYFHLEPRNPVRDWIGDKQQNSSLCLYGAPGAGRKALEKNVRSIGRTFSQLPAKLIQRCDPLSSIGSPALHTARGESANKKPTDLWREMRKSNAIRRGLHLSALRVWRKGKAEFADCLFYGHVAAAKKFPGKRMAPHK